MNLDDALQTFIIESRELLQSMEEALLRIEQEQDEETVNAIFRAAHTIKGSAGLFGLDFVVEFTHVAESVLDKVRSGELAIDSDLVALFLETCDHLHRLVDHVAEASGPDAETHGISNELKQRLNQYLGGPAAGAAPGASKHEASKPVASSKPDVEQIEPQSDEGVESRSWHISLRFGKDVLRMGMDPASFIRYLGKLGKIVRIVTVTDAMPAAAEMDPESCYLGFEIAFSGDVDKATIENVFEFVHDDCEVRILPPNSKMGEFLALIQELPEEEMRLGEILVRCGTLTRTELDDILKLQQSAGEPRPIGEVLVEQHVVQAPVVEAALQKQKQVKEHKSVENSLIRVDADKLDQLINLVGELIIAAAGASIGAQRAGQPELVEAAATLSRMVEEVRDSALSLRMVQIGATFNKFQRVVRDVSKELGKDIRLEISGAETELDKTVVEKIGDPLTHLVRNSMDHGIESAEVRRARGKPEQGVLKLNAYHDSGSIVIEVSDDGGGLNKDKILAKAIERGLVKPEQQLSDSEIYQLIFEAGFSTADAVSNLSGRGVGMDVVRRNIQALRGTVEIESQMGVGATMRIRLPLTLAIIDGFLVGVGESAYVVPLDLVMECIELTSEDNMHQESGYLNLRGEVLPYLRLRDLFEVEGEPARRENVVVVNYAGQKAGLVVDKLMGEFQTVIKPLGKVFSHTRGLSGFTILGTGEVALILDVQRLVQQTAGSERAMHERVLVDAGK